MIPSVLEKLFHVDKFFIYSNSKITLNPILHLKLKIKYLGQDEKVATNSLYIEVVGTLVFDIILLKMQLVIK